MGLDDILKLLEAGSITAAEARSRISLHSIDEIEGMARLDTGRANRRGVPEVLLAESKNIRDIKAIMERYTQKRPLLVSRIRDDHMEKVMEYTKHLGLHTDRGRDSSTILVWRTPLPKCEGLVGIITAGTSDIPIAEEARLVCRAMGCGTICRNDAGVAGLHRIFPVLREMLQSGVDCIVVVAGMEGALPTVVASMVDIPVIGVPVSVGYGYGGDGTAALASMLQSCALGLTVVNIDGGVPAGAAAATIAVGARRGHAPR